MKVASVSAIVLALVTLSACTGSPEPSDGAGLRIDFEKYELDNGLDVVLHQDDSDPIVAVALLYHVGSAREQPGRTGFAHLFEHLLFQNSENVGEGGFINGIPALGGTFNGGTSNDSTVYYEVVPRDALERVLWMESDRLGFFINTVNEPNLENEKQVVKNEKRQSVDNNPYGHTSDVLDSNLYPSDHPYHWQVIGSLEDLQAATLADAREFYDRFYGPQNCTLVLAGDFDVAEAKRLVEMYFGEIPAGEDVTSPDVPRVALESSRKLYHEDNFASLPALTLVWPTVGQYHPDSYPLNALAQLLTDGKSSPFYDVVVRETKLAPGVSAFNQTAELAGKFRLGARAFPGTDLDDLMGSFDQAFARFESEEIAEADLDRIKAGLETGFYNRISSILGKSFELAQYNVFAGDPGFVTEDLANIMAVTIDDVRRVYETYLKDRPYVAASFVPRGQADLTLADSARAEVYEEQIVEGAETAVVAAETTTIEKTPSAIDRSGPPALGETPTSSMPEVWTDELANGLRVYGIEQRELPLVRFSIRLDGGHLLDDPEMVGVANLMTDILMEGTAGRTPEELEQAIDDLGASINMFTSSQAITITGNSLARNYERTLGLAEEILLEPRWDAEAFELVKGRTISGIRQSSSSPPAIANRVFNKLLYGNGHILSSSVAGTEQEVDSITMDDLKDFYDTNFSPSVAAIHIAGAISQQDAMLSLTSLATRWEAKTMAIPEYALPQPTNEAAVYFVDIPNAPQSVIVAGRLALSQTDPDYYPAVVMNHQLGGGITGRFFQILRLEKGYTYGAGSGFAGTAIPGPFTASTSVRANVTYESTALIKEIMESYGSGFSEDDLTATKDALVRNNYRAFETLGALVGMLQNISLYDLPFDYIRQREQVVTGMTIPRVRDLAERYVDPGQMIYVVVGDAATQLARLSGLGYGAPIRLDRNANPVE